MKFKNLRRPSRSKAAGVVIEPPVAKKAKTNECDVVVDPVGYERHVEYLQNSYASKKWSVANMMTLLEQTAHQRREWISKETPSISEILKTFPCFADPRIVSKISINIHMFYFNTIATLNVYSVCKNIACLLILCLA